MNKAMLVRQSNHHIIVDQLFDRGQFE